MAKIPSRITVVGQACHQGEDGQIMPAGRQFSRRLQTDEQPFVRRGRAGEDWQPLPTGWLSQAGFLVLTNDEGVGMQVQPTEAERRDAAGKILEVSSCDGDPGAAWLVPPGEEFRGTPADLAKVRLRCRSGECRYTLTLFPL